MCKRIKKREQVFVSFLLLLVMSFSAYAQKTIKGTVLDESGLPLPGASVVVKGTSNGTSTNFDGKFSLKISENAKFLVVSYIGYKAKEVSVISNYLTISLEVEANALDEIIVVGYGTRKKSDLVGSVASVNVEEASVIPTTNVSEMLRGRAPGVQVNLGDARPGGKSNITIRGKVSIDGGNSPLIIVDGIPYDDINDVAPEDVANIEVLKDASSQAIYGARAANGVILITTKRGKEGKFKINYHGYTTIQSLTKNFDLYSAEEFAQLRREAERSDNGEVYRPDEDIFNSFELESLRDKNFVNWEDLVLKDAKINSHAISVSGGSEKTKVFSSINYFKQDGLIPTSGFERGTLRLNVDQKLSEKFSFQTNINFQTSKQDLESNSLNFISISPLAKPYDSEGNLNKFPLGEGSRSINPLWNIRESANEIKTKLTDINLVLKYQFKPNFSYKLNTFLRNRNAEQGIYRSSLHSSGDDGVNGRGVLATKIYRDFLIENIFEYTPEINDDHKLDLLLVNAVNERRTEEKSITKENFNNDFLGFNGNAAIISNATREVSERKLVSFLGRARYNLFDRYLFTLTARADASSVFAENNKWGFFPAAGFAWKIDEEDFLKDSKIINNLKLSVTYGDTGNEGINPKQSLGVANFLPYVFGGLAVGGNGTLNRLPNPNLKWETTTALNVGIDFGLFSNVLTGSVEYYKANTKDLLLDRILSGVSGYEITRFNIGEVENRGFDVGLNVNLIRNENLKWSVGAIWSSNRNEVLSLDGTLDADGKPLDFVSQGIFIGQPIDNIRNYQFDGIWQEGDDIANSAQPTAEVGDIRVKDIDGDGNIGQEDLIITRETPDWYGSVNMNIEYKGLEMFADLYIVEGATRLNNYLSDYNNGATLQGVLNGIKVDYYTPEDPSNEFPRPRTTAPAFLSSAAIKDASYVRLRTLSLGYNLPKEALSKINLSSAKIYLTGTNLFTITDYKSYSPENNAGAFPDAKGITVGVKLGL
ncbi:TonB-dependent receptor [Polaribacter batillariae]|uniref:TonB-dependent receptor n=1 Tax=Polaribacter batillariae TaxID=2808900 RepID=A0ABX7SZE1_9FLAO|nr:TonB-dependent receptor [Polaribacter batillariae]QTD38655.1 TonB-dependent receptor [Polaribacter batillariae]